LYVLRGHEGSVFSVAWLRVSGANGTSSADQRRSGDGMGCKWRSVKAGDPGLGLRQDSERAQGHLRQPTSGNGCGDVWMLATTSDDRSARLWALPDLNVRSLRRPDSAEAAPYGGPIILSPCRTFWGHTARVWCCAAVCGGGAPPGYAAAAPAGIKSMQEAPASAPGSGPNPGPDTTTDASITGSAAGDPTRSSPSVVERVSDVGSNAGVDGCGVSMDTSLMLVTGSEDCTARLWHAATGRCLAVMQGHRGRGIWRCAVHGSGGGITSGDYGCGPADSRGASGGAGVGASERGYVLATAGADSAIRLWSLREWLPAHIGSSQTGNLKNGMLAPSDSGSCESRGCEQSLGLGLGVVVRTAPAAHGALVEQIVRFHPRPLAPAVQSQPPDHPTGMQGQGSCGSSSIAPKQTSLLSPPTTTAGVAAATDGARCLALCGGGGVLLAATYSGAVYLMDLNRGIAGPGQEVRPRKEELIIDGLAGSQVQCDVRLQEKKLTTDPIRAKDAPDGAIPTFQSIDDDVGKRSEGGIRSASLGAGAGGSDESDGSDGSDGWVWLYDNPAEGPCTCLEVCALGTASYGHRMAVSDATQASVAAWASGCRRAPTECPDLVAVGHNSGVVSVLRVQRIFTGRTDRSTCDVLCSWRATDTGAVISAWWVAALGPSVLLTAAGNTPVIKLWRLPSSGSGHIHGAGATIPTTTAVTPARGSVLGPSAAATAVGAAAAVAAHGPAAEGTVTTATLAAIVRSPLRGRLLVADVCPSQRVIMAGDQYGNLLAFWVPPDVWTELTATSDSFTATTITSATAVAVGNGVRAAAAALSSLPFPPDLPCTAVFKAALGPGAASWVRLQQP
ncbi:hypothetical protein Vretimale_2818, partial [Volvox reticuliferus]